MIRIVVAIVVFSAASLPAWADDHEERELVVFAASSLSDAFIELGAAFEAQNPEIDVIFNFAGSNILATQLAQGAPADVFASANAHQMNVVVASDLVAALPKTFVYNRLILALPADNPAEIESLRDLANDDIFLVLAAEGVPIRAYSDSVLAELSSESFFGEAFRETVMENVVSEETNVRQVVAKIALGEADAGLVYQTDITPDIAEQIVSLPVPAAINPLAAYPLAVLPESANPDAAQAFVDYVLSEPGQATLASWGFLPLASVICDEPPEDELEGEEGPCVLSENIPHGWNPEH